MFIFAFQMNKCNTMNWTTALVITYIPEVNVLFDTFCVQIDFSPIARNNPRTRRQQVQPELLSPVRRTMYLL